MAKLCDMNPDGSTCRLKEFVEYLMDCCNNPHEDASYWLDAWIEERFSRYIKSPRCECGSWKRKYKNNLDSSRNFVISQTISCDECGKLINEVDKRPELRKLLAEGRVEVRLVESLTKEIGLL